MEDDIQDHHRDILNKIKKVELDLVKQEHRPIKLLKTIFSKNENKEIKKAAIIALILRWFFSPVTVAISSSILVGGATIYLMYTQTELIKNQNNLIQQQIHIQESTRKVSQNDQLNSILHDFNNELNDSKNNQVSEVLISRIIMFTNIVNDHINYSQKVIPQKQYSILKGALFRVLINSKINQKQLREILLNADFTYSSLTYLNLNELNLSKCNFEGSNFSHTTFNKCDLDKTNLNNSNLNFSYFNNSSLNKAYLKNTKYSNIITLDNIETIGLDEIYINEDNIRKNH